MRLITIQDGPQAPVSVFPDYCILKPSYVPTVKLPKRYLGKKVALVDRDYWDFDIFFRTREEAQTFFNWYNSVLVFGTEVFTIDLPMWGSTQTVDVVFVNDLTETYESGDLSISSVRLMRVNNTISMNSIIIDNLVVTGATYCSGGPSGCAISNNATVSISGEPWGTINYFWEIEDGTVNSGQGTDNITFESHNADASTLTTIKCTVSDSRTASFIKETVLYTREIVTFFATYISQDTTHIYTDGSFEFSNDNVTWNTGYNGGFTHAASGQRYYRIINRIPYVVFNNTTGTMSNGITDLVVDGVVSSAKDMFANSRALVNLDITGLDISKATSTEDMFYYCTSLSTLDTSTLDTSNITNMVGMFEYCYRIGTLDVGGFDTSKVTNMNRMFWGCYAVTSLDINNWNTNNVTDVAYLLTNCRALGNVDISTWNLAQVQQIYAMFYGCYAMTSIDMSQHDLPIVNNINSLFYMCSSATEIKVPTISSRLYYMSDTFEGCSSLTELNLKRINTVNTDYFRDAFKDCTALECITNLDTRSHVATGTDLMFDNTPSLVQPNATAQSNLEAGAIWTNSGACGEIGVVPTITIFGDTVYDHPENVTYVDQGASAFDYEDGDISSSIVRSGATDANVNAAANGASLSINYDVVDSDMNPAIQRTRTVNVVAGVVIGNIPVITITGDDVYEHPENETYVDQGATAWDNEDGDITGSIVRSGAIDATINAAVNGDTLPIYYNVVDSDTNSATQKTRIINVVAAAIVGTIPVITVSGDTVYDHPENVTYVDQGATAYDVEDGDITSNIIRGGATDANVNAAVNGDSLVINYDVVDSDNNPAVQKTRTVNVQVAVGFFEAALTLGGNITLYFEDVNLTGTGFEVSTNNGSSWTPASISGNTFELTSSATNVRKLDGALNVSFGNRGGQDANNLQAAIISGAGSTTTYSMFRGCAQMTSVDLTGFDTSLAIDADYMFTFCSNLTSLDLSMLDVSLINDMSYMFYGCSELLSIDLTTWNTSSVVNMVAMFRNSPKLTCITNLDTTSVTNKDNMFIDCTSLVQPDATAQADLIDASGANWTNLTACPDVSFSVTITSPVEPTVFDVTGGSLIYDDNGDGTWHVHTTDPITAISWRSNDDITAFVADGGNTLTNMGSMFYNCSNLTTIDLTGFNTSTVTNMYAMFVGCSGLTTLDLTSFDTALVTDMRALFERCSILTTVDLTGFDTSNVTDMGYMFYQCFALTSLDVTSFNTSSVTTTFAIFADCSSLTSLNLTSFDMSSSADMAVMFLGCTNLNCITNLDTTNAPAKSSIFDNCPALVQPDATAQADLTDANGADWTNPGVCP